MTNQSYYPQCTGAVATRPGEEVLKLLVRGFTSPERQLLDAIVQFSQRRQPRICLLDDNIGERADVVMIDAADAGARAWAASQPWLRQKAVIWVDAPGATTGTLLKRPVQWSALPVLLAQVLEQAPAQAPAAQTAASNRAAILVVDDSLAVRAQVRALLEPQGLTVTDVDSAEAAIAAASASPYACVLMDVLMPGIDGYEACRRIKANPSGSNRPPVIMLTSKSSPFDRIRGKMAGCDAYLTKPIDPPHLQEVISRYVAAPADFRAVAPRFAPSF